MSAVPVPKPSTTAYYDAHAASFFESTVGVDLVDLRRAFLSQIPLGGHILDAGCGSGRDARAFLDAHYRVSAFDASPALAQLASAHLGQTVAVRRFQDVQEQACYDGVWACASLLHVPAAELPACFERLWTALKPGGCFYFSFKVGQGEREQDGRHFTDAHEAQVSQWVKAWPRVARVHQWRSADQRPGRPDTWLNVQVNKAPTPPEKLISGEGAPFLPHLRSAIQDADEIDMAVAFTKVTGLRLLIQELREALQTVDGGRERPARLRFLTSDYLDVTDPEALRLLQTLQDQGADVRVFETAGSSFHMKAYVFTRFPGHAPMTGVAFIGSSNLSQMALQQGLEWNYRIQYPEDEGFVETRSRFDQLFVHPHTRTLTDAWIRQYAARRRSGEVQGVVGSAEQEAPPVPTSVQKEALAALNATRAAGYRRGLVVLATGLGKTWLAAFDAVQSGALRVLFVAHREEILDQAADTFLRIRPQARVGFLRGGQHDREVDVLCASVQTLSRRSHLQGFSPQHFDYIVVDEFHHASAATYRQVIDHFDARFLLGLTATPDRTDQSDILSLCDDNLVFTVQLVAGIQAGLLAPFHYYGVDDVSVDYQSIPWRQGRFDPEALTNKLATVARSRHVLSRWRLHAQWRTLAFCVSVKHAVYMAEAFQAAGIAAEAVYAGSPCSRNEGLQALQDGRLQVLFSVDLFNEGVDLPEIDTVMMLRPTESKILFLQQLGRGLRRSPRKTHLVVIDFVANHTSFLHKPQALFGTAAQYPALAALGRQLADGSAQSLLPDGCFVNFDVGWIDFLKALESDRVEGDYAALRDSLGRRPTLTEFWRAGGRVREVRKQYGHWWAFVNAMGGVPDEEALALEALAPVLRDIEQAPMTKSFKMVTLEAMNELGGWATPPTLDVLSARSWAILKRRPPLWRDVPQDLQAPGQGESAAWRTYWRKNPVAAWLGTRWFEEGAGRFTPRLSCPPEHRVAWQSWVQELVDYRLAGYEGRVITHEGYDPSSTDAPSVWPMGTGNWREAVGRAFMREDIPALFGEVFNPGNWHAGHVVLKQDEQDIHVLLVTLDKSQAAEQYRYQNRWISPTEFQWQSQNQTTSSSARGQALIHHAQRSVSIHLFVRDQKLSQKKAAPFVYFGRVNYVRHSGEKPMSVVFQLVDMPLTPLTSTFTATSPQPSSRARA